MKTYQDFVWSKPEELSIMVKQKIIQRMQLQHGFVFSAVSLFLLMAPAAIIAKARFELTVNGVILYLIINAVLSIVISYIAVKDAEKRKVRLLANNFVWRYGTVTRTRKSKGYYTTGTEVDGQAVAFIFEASEGDTVIVIGIDTAHDSKTKAKFYAVSVN